MSVRPLPVIRRGLISIIVSMVKYRPSLGAAIVQRMKRLMVNGDTPRARVGQHTIRGPPASHEFTVIVGTGWKHHCVRDVTRRHLHLLVHPIRMLVPGVVLRSGRCVGQERQQ
jgi:hypothetical protein